MTAYTSASDEINSVHINQEGAIRKVVVNLAKLANADSLDLTPWVLGGKAFNVKAIDHTTTVIGGTTSTSNSSEYVTSMVVSTDVVTFSAGANTSADAIVSFDVMPS